MAQSSNPSTPAKTSAETKPAKRSRLRRVLRGTAWTVLGLVILLGLLVGFVHTSWGKEVVRSRVEKALQKRTTGALALGAVDYGFLFSDVSLQGLEIRDASGEPAITLRKLYVDLDRRSLIDGAPILEQVVIDGARVSIRKNADGTSNLTGLMVPSERKGRRIVIDSLELRDVAVSITRPDGSSTEIIDVGAIGHASIDSIDRRYAADLSSFGAGVTIKKPDGTVLEVPSTRTALRATATATTAGVEIDPVKVSATLTRPGQAPSPVRVEIGVTTLNRDGSRIQMQTGGIVLGPLSLAKVTADVEAKDGALHERQLISLDGLVIAHKPLAELLGRDVLVSDVAANVKIEGPAEALAIGGAVVTDGGQLVLDGSVDARELKRPVYKISLTGTELETAKILSGERPSLESSLLLSVSGHGVPRRPGAVTDIELTVGPSKLAADGKSIDVEQVAVKARAEGQAVELESLVVKAFGLEIAASGTLSESRAVTARIGVDGNVRRAVTEVRSLGITIRPLPLSLPRSLDLDIKASGDLDGAIAVELAPTSIPLAGGSARLSGRALLDRSGGQTLRQADATVSLRRVRIEKLARIARRDSTLKGTVSGELSLRQRGKRRTVGYDIKASLANPALNVQTKGTLGARRLETDTVVFSRELEAVVATIDGSIPLVTRRGKRTIDPNGRLELELEVLERTFESIKRFVPERVATKLDSRARSGTVALAVSLRGTPAAPTGTVRVRGRAQPVALPKGELIASIDAVLTPTSGGGLVLEPNISLGAASIDGAIATVGGKVTLGRLFRKGRLDRAGAIRDAKLAVRVDIAKRPLASLAPLRPALANMPGDVVMSIKATGSPKEPELEAAGEWSGYETATGEAGRVTLGASGTPKAMTATVSLGASNQARLSVVAARETDAIRIGVRAEAQPVKLAELLPKRANELGGLVAEFGELESKFGAEVVMHKRADGLELGKVDLNGFLEVRDAKVVVTGSKREIRDIRFRLEGERDIFRLAELSALESDEQESERRISIGVEASLAAGRPKTVRGSINASKWLVFGGSMGEANSPHASVDTEINVVADISGKRPVIDATVVSLDFRSPDRAIRDHGLQYVSTAGDIKFKDETALAVGKLGVPVSGEPPEPRKRKPMLVRLHIPKPVRLVKAPLDVKLSGEMAVEITEDGIAPNGSFKIHGGEVALFGHKHAYSGGGIVFDAERPNGELSLVFANTLPPATLRQLSKASGGREVKIRIGGSASKQKIVLAGAGNAGMLEVMSIHNAGRSYYYTEPDLPASSTVQAPQLLQPMVITYIATNLSHLLVLDRFSAWADPYDARDSYGRVEHFVGERTSVNQKNRVRIVSRPRRIGRSRTEVQLDRILVNTAQTAFGAGVRAGSRLGGGLALFFEWSSAR